MLMIVCPQMFFSGFTGFSIVLRLASFTRLSFFFYLTGSIREQQTVYGCEYRDVQGEC